jgi:chaperonin GroES
MKILEYIDSPNIAEKLDEKKLLKIAQKVIEEYGEDRDSMSDWAKSIDRGMKLAKPAMESKSFPWEGASNYKSPLIYEAVISFGDRATTEILHEKNLVRGCITGKDTEEKNMRMTRVADFMNWQFNYEMPEWRAEQEMAFYALPSYGCFFKKTYFDPTEGRNKSVPIFYPNFAVNQNERSMNALTRFTECKQYCKAEINEFIAAGIWLDQEYIKDEDDLADIDADDKDASDMGAIHDDFLEQHCMIDLDDDGIAEPYIVTVHKETEQVARIVARFDKSSILVKVADGVVEPLERAESKAVQQAAVDLIPEVLANPDDNMTEQELLQQVMTTATDMLKIVKIKPVNMITKYGFIQAPDGTLLNWGYCHLLTSQLEMVNTTSNQLIDSGTLANLGGGFKSKEFRQNKSPMRVSPGEFNQVDVDAATLQQGLLPYPFKEPSVGLMQLNETTKAETRQLASMINLQDTLAPNAPAATTLGILQEKLIPTTALIGRILRSMGEEFGKMFDLNMQYTDPLMYQEVLDDQQADYKADFTRAGYDIEPVADAGKSSMMQKMQSAQVLLELMPVIQSAGGDIKSVVKETLDAIGRPELMQQLFAEQQPDPQLMEMEQQRIQLEQMNVQLQQQNNDLLQKQHEIKMAELELKAQELQRKLKEGDDKTALEAAKLDAEAGRIQADEELKVAQTFKTYVDAEVAQQPKVDISVVPDGLNR